MATAQPPAQPPLKHAAENRFVLYDVPWEMFQLLRNAPGLERTRMTSPLATFPKPSEKLRVREGCRLRFKDDNGAIAPLPGKPPTPGNPKEALSCQLLSFARRSVLPS